MKYDNRYYPDELYHYGVKGMKWGHRKAQDTINKYNPIYRGLMKNAEKHKDELVSGKRKPWNYAQKDLIKKAKAEESKAQISKLKKQHEAYEQKQKKAEASEKRKYEKSLSGRFDKASEKYKDLTYDKIYNSDIAKQVTKEYRAKFGNNSFREDLSYYKEIEDRYLKSIGY